MKPYALVHSNASHLLEPFACLLLDMNRTFMFGEDRFGPAYDYAATYRALGGGLSSERVRAAIDACYHYLDVRYPHPVYRDRFPTVREVLRLLPETAGLDEDERERLERTFAAHELGHVPPAYAAALERLAATHRLALVADVWSEQQPWLDELARAGVLGLFEALIFSSAIGSVKPSPRPLRMAIEVLEADPSACVVIGDSARRDVGGARAAGLQAIWIGEGPSPRGVVAVPDLLCLVAEPSHHT